MSDITCLCGKLTNTAVSDWCDPRRKDGKAYKCYAAWDGKKWVKGCAYDKCDSYTKQTVDSLLSPNKGICVKTHSNPTNTERG